MTPQEAFEREPSGKRKEKDYLDPRECRHASYLTSDLGDSHWAPLCCDCGVRAIRAQDERTGRWYWTWPRWKQEDE